MTRQLKIVNAGTAFGKWFRSQLKDSRDGLAIFDIDTMIYLFYDYKASKIMLIEEKANGDSLSWSQGKSLKLLDEIISIGCKAKGVEYRGLHTVFMDGADPSLSKNIVIDTTKVEESELVDILNFDTKVWWDE